MNNFKKSLLIFTLILSIFVGSYSSFVLATSYYEDISKFAVEIDYQEYLNKYENTKNPNKEYIIQAEDYTDTSMNIEMTKDLGNMNNIAIKTNKEGYIEWEVNVEEDGLYNLAIKYYPIKGRGSSIERELEINGERPFEGAKFLTFHRIWTDGEEIKEDNQGNELRPVQKESPIWQEEVLKDSMGSYQKPYKIYLKEGKNIIKLISRREPMAIDYLKVFQVDELPKYKEVANKYKNKDYQKASDVMIKLQERDATYRSSPTLFPQSDKGDPTLEPYDPVLIKLNSIGGESWDKSGEWIRWDFEVPKDGLYKIAFKGKQNFQRGSFSNRKIYIDSKVPFKELEAMRIPYSSNYQMITLKDENQEDPYLFYLEKGEHSITMEVVLGDLVETIRTMKDSIYKLNNLYRQIIMITSPTPDAMRTYQLEERIPNLKERLKKEGQILKEIANQFEEYTGQKGGNTVLLQDLSRQLFDLAKEPESIPSRLDKLRDNIGGLGTWLLNIKKQPLEIDYLLITSPEKELPRAKPTKKEIISHELKALKASYTHNYKMVGNVYDKKKKGFREPLKVWIGMGRDQAQILKRLIENDFTPKTGIPINLELVNMGVLLPATLAGTGPDVAIGVPPAQPINFALRGAVTDLSQFSDFEKVASRFMHSAMVPFMFRDSVYAIPEQQPFPMLFYRKDVLKEKGLEIPKTWDDVIEVIAELQKDNMNFGLPFSKPPKTAAMGIGNMSNSAGSLSASSGALTLVTFINQKGEELYKVDGLETNFESEPIIDAFSRWTELYELYKLPLQYDAANRFRTGEVPILITGYTFYNKLTVFAPELRGKWGFTLIPGTVKEDKTVDRSVPAGNAGAGQMAGLSATPSGGLASLILKNCENKQAAWEFLKWWTSEDVQVQFGKQLESIMGPAARYPTANVEAMERLPWAIEDYEKLSAQWEWVRGIPEIPGGYMIGRYLDNAFRQVVYDNKSARDTLLDYNSLINEEIKRKRKEFGFEATFEELEAELKTFYWKNDLIEGGGK